MATHSHRTVRRFALAITAATVLGASGAGAQTSLGIAGGTAAPVGSGAQELNAGYSAALSIGIQPPLAPIGLRLEGMFNSFNYAEDIDPDGARRLLSLTLNVTFSGFVPRVYAIAGMGAYRSQIDGIPDVPRENYEMGFNAGVGINLPVSGFSSFVEARFHHVPFEGTTLGFVPVTFGIRF